LWFAVGAACGGAFWLFIRTRESERRWDPVDLIAFLAATAAGSIFLGGLIDTLL
jgi:hypothetical protein